MLSYLKTVGCSSILRNSGVNYHRGCRQALLSTTSCLGIKTDWNGRENSSTISVFVFYYGKRERERNSRVREWKWDITVMETGGNRKIYLNALLFNHHSLYMNITLDTPLPKLFFKNMINVFCFLLLNREVHVLMLRNMRGYIMCLLFFLDFINKGLIWDYSD